MLLFQCFPEIFLTSFKIPLAISRAKPPFVYFSFPERHAGGGWVLHCLCSRCQFCPANGFGSYRGCRRCEEGPNKAGPPCGFALRPRTRSPVGPGVGPCVNPSLS